MQLYRASTLLRIPSTIVGFGDRRRIDEVVLVRLDEWLHILRRHQSHLAILLLQSPVEEMRSAAGLHADQFDAQVRGKVQELGTRQSLPNDYAAPKIKSNQVKTRLAKINAERLQFRGIPPPFTYYTSPTVS